MRRIVVQSIVTKIMDRLTECYVIIFFQQVAIQDTVVQLTQIDGNASMHIFIILSLVTFPRWNAGWAL